MTDMNETGRSRTRSPGYPAIDLRSAIRRAQELFDREKSAPTPVDVAMDHWGYSPSSGPGRSTLSAVRKFGLIEYEGSGRDKKIKLTRLFNDIAFREEGSPERMNAIRRAALLPSIHGELYEQYGAELPSDESLKFELVRERSFNPAAVEDFIEEYRSTLEFSGLDQPDALSPSSDELMPSMTSSPQRDQAPGVAPVLSSSSGFTIPISTTKALIIQGVPLTDAEHEKMRRLLDIYEDDLKGRQLEDNGEDAEVTEDLA